MICWKLRLNESEGKGIPSAALLRLPRDPAKWWWVCFYLEDNQKLLSRQIIISNGGNKGGVPSNMRNYVLNSNEMEKELFRQSAFYFQMANWWRAAAAGKLLDENETRSRE